MTRMFEMTNTIDDSAKVVARDFLKKMRGIDSPKQKVKLAKVNGEVKPVRADKPKKAVKAKAAKAGSLREKAFALFRDGVTVADVSRQLDITYANAHYYKRAFNKAGS